MSADTRLEELGVSGLGKVDESAFSGLAERHRRELHVHCYRMLGSFQDAEDTVQETFLRAWRWRETFEGRSTFRAWLYRIATNACLDLLAERRPEPATGGEVLWLQPYPDRLLDELPADDADEPETVAVAQLQLHPPASDDAERVAPLRRDHRDTRATAQRERPHRDYWVPSVGRRSGSASRGNWSAWNVTISVIAPPVTRRTSIVSGR